MVYVKMAHSRILPFAPSEDQSFCFKGFYYTTPNSLILISQQYTSFGGNCNRISFSNLPALKTSVDRHPIYRMSHTLNSPFQNSLLCALGRPEFCLKRFYYTIPNSLMLISQKFTSFEGNCNSNFFLKFARLHSKILHFAPSEDQIFALNVSITRFRTV